MHVNSAASSATSSWVTQVVWAEVAMGVMAGKGCIEHGAKEFDDSSLVSILIFSETDDVNEWYGHI